MCMKFYGHFKLLWVFASNSTWLIPKNQHPDMATSLCPDLDMWDISCSKGAAGKSFWTINCLKCQQNNISAIFKEISLNLLKHIFDRPDHYHMNFSHLHYSDVIMGAIEFQITGLPIVYSTVCSGADQGKHQSSAPLAFVRGIHWWPVNSPHKGPVTRKMFPFGDVGMECDDCFEFRRVTGPNMQIV